MTDLVVAYVLSYIYACIAVFFCVATVSRRIKIYIKDRLELKYSVQCEEYRTIFKTQSIQ